MYRQHSTKLDDLGTVLIPEDESQSILHFCRSKVVKIRKQKPVLYVYVTPSVAKPPSSKKRKTASSSTVKYFEFVFITDHIFHFKSVCTSNEMENLSTVSLLLHETYRQGYHTSECGTTYSLVPACLSQH